MPSVPGRATADEIASVEDGDDSAADLEATPGSEDASLAALLRAMGGQGPEEAAVELEPGTELGEAYRIVRRLGAGGMGVVYLARDLALQRDVAVKVHRVRSGIDRLYREALAMAQLAHPNVVAVHGVGRVDDRLYVAMELVPGENLAGWLAQQPRTWRQIVDVVAAVGDGLAAAHDAGFVHRDVKPHNILVGSDGRPRVGDFGLVRFRADSGRRPRGELTLTDDGAGSDPVGATLAPVDVAVTPAAMTPSSLDRELTTFGTTMGTPAYMAPEQLAGDVVDARADQFALCVVLYEALYGERPFAGATIAELRQAAAQTPKAPTRAGVPSWLWPAIRRGLAASPVDRYPDVRALVAALRSPPRHGWRIALAVTAVAAVAVGAYLVLRPSPPLPSCDRAGIAASSVWGPTVRNKIAAQYAKLDASGGPVAARAFAVAAEAWSARWQLAAETACVSMRDGRWSAAVAASSRACTESSLAALRALVTRATTGDALVADTAGLPDPEACADPLALAGGATAPLATLEGHWRGDFGELVLRRVGDEIWGVYRHDSGSVRGRMVGDRFVGWWCELPSRAPPGDAGDVEMRAFVDRDGVEAIAGRWRYGTTAAWDDRWDLTRDPSPAPPDLEARFADPATFCQPTR